jgi:hypothetical protein
LHSFKLVDLFLGTRKHLSGDPLAMFQDADKIFENGFGAKTACNLFTPFDGYARTFRTHFGGGFKVSFLDCFRSGTATRCRCREKTRLAFLACVKQSTCRLDQSPAQSSLNKQIDVHNR